MTIVSRPTSLHPPVETFAELAAWLVRQIENLDADCTDSETIGMIGLEAHKRSQTRVATYRDVLHQIAPAILLEESDRKQAAADDAAENRWKEAYGPDFEMLGAYNAEGR